MKLIHSSFKGALLASTVLMVPTAVYAQDQAAQDNVEEITVQGRYVPDEKRATSEISNVMDSEAFSQIGASDVAVALQAVPGLSVVGGKYVYVRGLGDRYSSTLLNGSAIPSPEPLRRVVPLDIFPTAMIESVLVQKTFSPEYPGAFGGGVVDLRTKKVPDEFILEVGLSTKYNSESTFKSGLSFDGPNSEIFGFGGSSRNIPEQLLKDVTLASLTPEEREAAAEALPNVWSIDKEDNYPGVGVDFLWGNRYDVGNDGAIGFFAAVTYDEMQTNKEGIRRGFNKSNAGLVERFAFSPNVCRKLAPEGAQNVGDDCGFRQTTMDIDLNGILSLGYEINPNNAINITSTVLRQSQKRALIEKGFIASEKDEIRTSSSIDWVESQVWTNQIEGEHVFTPFGDSATFLDTELDWRFNYSRADRDAPLGRSISYVYDPTGDQYITRPRQDFNTTSFSALDEESYEAGFDLKQPMNLGNFAVDLKTGFTYNDKDRGYGVVRYYYAFPSGHPAELRTLVPEIIFGPVNVGPGGITLQEKFDASDYFTAGFETYQGYLSADVELSERLRFAFGVRYEDSTQTADTVDRTTDLPVTVTQDASYWLPAGTLTYEIIDNMQVRLAYSQTITRPDLRELSSAPFTDYDRNRTIRGNPNLKITEVENYDARFEWYFAAGESLTVGAFYKKFDNPIEETFSILGEGPLGGYINAAKAELKGVEVEVQKDLPLQDWFGWSWLGDREVYLRVNGSYIDSETTIDPANLPAGTTTTNLVRPMQGQSDWLANVTLGWENYTVGESAALVLNYTGERLSGVGINFVEDEYERPPVMLNFIYKRDIPVGAHTLELSFKAENLMKDDQTWLQEGQITEKYEIGRTFSLGMTYKF